MTFLISPPFVLWLVVGVTSCNPKQASTGLPAAETVVADDTTRPVMPTTTNWPLENPLLVTVPYNPSLKNFRDVFGIEFDTSTGGAMIHAFLVRFNAVIIGGYGQGTSAPTYVVRVPDPGTTFQAIDSLVAVMGAYNGVRQARAMNYEGSLRLKKSD